MSTNTTDNDVDEEHSATDDESNDGEADNVAEITIRRNSRGWELIETTENVVRDVSYVITLPPRQRITLKTEVGRPESDSNSDSDDTDDD